MVSVSQVNGNIGQQFIGREHAFQVTPAIAPTMEFLDDPGRKPGRRIGQCISQGLRFCALLVVVTAFGIQPIAARCRYACSAASLPSST